MAAVKVVDKAIKAARDAGNNEMLQALEAIARLREAAATVGVAGNREYNPGWHTALDLHNMLTVSEAVAKAALNRKESRGAHAHEDYPDRDDENWMKHTLSSLDASGNVAIDFRPVHLYTLTDDVEVVPPKPRVY